MYSIIIPAYNEEHYIIETLESIKAQKFKQPYEIIVVANGCTDKTIRLAEKEADLVIKKYEKLPPSIARNVGVKHSKGDYYIFLDADTTVSENLLTTIHEEKNNFLVATAKVLPSNPSLKHKLMMFLKNVFVCPFGISNGIIICSKNAYDTMGGFSEEMMKAEDARFVRGLKQKGKFKILKPYVVTSTRRFDHEGYIKIGLYWLKEIFSPSKEEYPQYK